MTVRHAEAGDHLLGGRIRQLHAEYGTGRGARRDLVRARVGLGLRLGLGSRSGLGFGGARRDLDHQPLPSR